MVDAFLKRIDTPCVDNLDDLMTTWFKRPLRNTMLIPITPVGEYGTVDFLNS